MFSNKRIICISIFNTENKEANDFFLNHYLNIIKVDHLYVVMNNSDEEKVEQEIQRISLTFNKITFFKWTEAYNSKKRHKVCEFFFDTVIKKRENSICDYKITVDSDEIFLCDKNKLIDDMEKQHADYIQAALLDIKPINKQKFCYNFDCTLLTANYFNDNASKIPLSKFNIVLKSWACHAVEKKHEYVCFSDVFPLFHYKFWHNENSIMYSLNLRANYLKKIKLDKYFKKSHSLTLDEVNTLKDEIFIYSKKNKILVGDNGDKININNYKENIINWRILVKNFVHDNKI